MPVFGLIEVPEGFETEVESYSESRFEGIGGGWPLETACGNLPPRGGTRDGGAGVLENPGSSSSMGFGTKGPIGGLVGT